MITRRFVLLFFVPLLMTTSAKNEISNTFRQISSPHITAAFDQNGDIYVTDFDGEPINVTNSAAYDSRPVWSPDGSQIAYLSRTATGDGAEYLQVVTLATGKIRQLSNLELTDEANLAWSPDGRSIAVTLGDLFVVDTQSGDTQRLRKDFYADNPSWFPDGSRIVFDGAGEIYTIDREGQDLQRIAKSPPNTYKPLSSPVLDDVVFMANRGDILGIYILHDMKANLVVEMPGYAIYAPYWSPNGQYIAFGVSAEYASTVKVPGGNDIYVVNSDGSNLRLLTGAGNDLFIGWSPDNQYIVYWKGVPGSASGAFYALSIVDSTETQFKGLKQLCDYGCPTVAIRPH